MPLANTGPLASEALQRLRKAATVVYDVETSGLDPWKCYPIGHVLTFGPLPVDSYYVPLRHSGGGNLEHGEERFNVPEADWTPAPFEMEMWRLLEGKRIVGHNLGFDLGFLAGFDTTTASYNDTMVMAYITNELRVGFTLAECCIDEKVQAKKGDDLYKYLAQTLGVPEKKTSMSHFWQTNAAATIVHDYATGDGTSTWQLWEKLLKQIEAEDLLKVHRIESRLLPILHRMRMHGVAVDQARLAEVIEYSERQCKLAQAAIGEVNVRSQAEVKAYLESAGIRDGWPLTPKGSPNFSEKWLLTTEPGRQIVAVRKHRTLLESFLRPLVETHLRDGRVHSEWHQSKDADQFGTITGRLSSTSPNMTQIPGKRQGARGKYFRSIFKPDHGQWVEADFHACEVRIAAHYSRAKLWVDGFASGIDPHTAVATALSIDRRHAKTINLGLIMGMGSKKLASELGLGEREGNAVMDRYFGELPELRQLQVQAARKFEDRGWVRTISGRKLRLREPKAAFTAVNRLTQGGCADLLKSRLIEMDEIARAHPETELLVNVHDSISWQTADPEADRALRHAMVGTDQSEIVFSIPMAIDVHEGPDWGAATFPEAE